MDTALPAEDRVAVWQILKSHEQAGVKFHALWARQAGARKFISLHVLVPGDWTVQRGHQLLERVEEIFAKRCWTRRSSHILNHWMIRPHGTTKPLIDGSCRWAKGLAAALPKGLNPEKSHAGKKSSEVHGLSR
jgi:hypothetical protein